MSGRAMNGESQRGLKKEKDVRLSNIMAAKAIADAIRTSLGPRGMDKMIQKGDGEVLITNDGATILSTMEVGHPTAKMLVELSKSQDVEAGDGTTSVCVLAGALLDACHQLLAKGLHPTTIAEAFVRANAECGAILRRVAEPVDLGDRATLVDAVATCLSSKVIAQNSDALAPLAVDAVLGVVDAAAAATVDLDRVKIVKQVGGTVDDTELVDGIVFAQGAKKAAGGPTRVANAKIGLIQFCLSAPKTDMENSVVVSDYAAMDRLLREERKHVLGLCKKVKKAGVTVLLIQKSILRDAYNDLSLHFLAKMGILVVADVAPRAAFDRRSGRSRPHFEPLELGRIEVDPARFRTSRRRSNVRVETVRYDRSGRRFEFRVARAAAGAARRGAAPSARRGVAGAAELRRIDGRWRGATSRTSPTRSACCPSRAGPRGGDSRSRRVERTPRDGRPSTRGPGRADRDRGASLASRDRRAPAPRRSRTSTASRPRPWAPRTSSTRCPCPARRRRSSRSRASRAPVGP
mmetsp:Transcript_19283/g.66879  ORF Transcript_19283/g.66879 Transcript_19283/m.66879 type:complete len:520 (+) Transcript_19283:105-1664(+)